MEHRAHQEREGEVLKETPSASEEHVEKKKEKKKGRLSRAWSRCWHPRRRHCQQNKGRPKEETVQATYGKDPTGQGHTDVANDASQLAGEPANPADDQPGQATYTPALPAFQEGSPDVPRHMGDPISKEDQCQGTNETHPEPCVTSGQLDEEVQVSPEEAEAEVEAEVLGQREGERENGHTRASSQEGSPDVPEHMGDPFSKEDQCQGTNETHPEPCVTSGQLDEEAQVRTEEAKAEAEVLGQATTTYDLPGEASPEGSPEVLEHSGKAGSKEHQQKGASEPHPEDCLTSGRLVEAAVCVDEADVGGQDNIYMAHSQCLLAEEPTQAVNYRLGQDDPSGQAIYTLAPLGKTSQEGSTENLEAPDDYVPKEYLCQVPHKSHLKTGVISGTLDLTAGVSPNEADFPGQDHMNLTHAPCGLPGEPSPLVEHRLGQACYTSTLPGEDSLEGVPEHLEPSRHHKSHEHQLQVTNKCHRGAVRISGTLLQAAEVSPEEADTPGQDHIYLAHAHCRLAAEPTQPRDYRLGSDAPLEQDHMDLVHAPCQQAGEQAQLADCLLDQHDPQAQGADAPALLVETSKEVSPEDLAPKGDHMPKAHQCQGASEVHPDASMISGPSDEAAQVHLHEADPRSQGEKESLPEASAISGTFPWVAEDRLDEAVSQGQSPTDTVCSPRCSSAEADPLADGCPGRARTTDQGKITCPKVSAKHSKISPSCDDIVERYLKVVIRNLKYQDFRCVYSFLRVYRVFATTQQVLDLVFNGYTCLERSSPEEDYVKSAMSTFLETWIDKYPEDFLKSMDVETMNQLMTYITENLAASNLVPRVQFLLSQLENQESDSGALPGAFPEVMESKPESALKANADNAEATNTEHSPVCATNAPA